MKKHRITEGIVNVWQRLITWSALAPATALGLSLVQTQAQEQSPLLQGEDGFVIWEAEDFDRNPDELWIEDTDREGASGEISMLIPNGAGGNENNTQLQYDIVFTKTGTHIIWYRAGGDSGKDDSIWLHVDGERPPNRTSGNQASMTGFNGDIFAWKSKPQEGGGQMTFNIDDPGLHTIAVARREDGAYADKFIITTDSSFNPTTSGNLDRLRPHGRVKRWKATTKWKSLWIPWIPKEWKTRL